MQSTVRIFRINFIALKMICNSKGLTKAQQQALADNNNVYETEAIVCLCLFCCCCCCGCCWSFAFVWCVCSGFARIQFNTLLRTNVSMCVWMDGWNVQASPTTS